MAQATRLGDKNSGHDTCSPVALMTSSETVRINGKGAGRVGDAYESHGCDTHSPHVGVIASGSSSVFINGRAAARVGDTVSCGGTVAEGSGNVFIGG